MYIVTLDGRTLYRDGSWNTLCLPFTVSLTGYNPLFGATDVRVLSSTSYDSASGTLTLNFTTTEEIAAGTPFILKWEDNGQSNITNPEFEDVTIPSSVVAGTTSTTYANLAGSFSPVPLTADDKTVLYLGAGNTLYYPNSAMTVGSCRAVFKLKGLTAGDLPNNVRAFVLNFGDRESTGIRPTPNPSLYGGEWYDLSGRKLSGRSTSGSLLPQGRKKPTTKGLYINNGKKVVIK